MSSNNSVDSGSESRRGVIAQYLDGLSGLIGIIIFANYLGVSNLGKYYVFVAISQVIASPTDGVSVYVEHMIGKVKDNNKIPRIISFGVLANIVIPLVLGLFIVGVYSYFPIVNSYATKLEIILLIGMSISYSVKFTLTSSYSGLGNPSNSIFISSGEGFVQTLFQILLLIELGISGLLLGTILANTITILYVIKKPSINFSKPKIEFKKMLNYTQWSIITYVTRSIYDRLGTIMLVTLLSSAVVGIYQATIKIIESSRFVSDGICRSLMVKFSQENDNYPVEDLNKNGSYASIISIPMIFGGAVIGQDLLTVLYNDPEYAAGYYVLIGGSIYFAIKAHSIVLNSTLNGCGKPKIATLSLIIGMFSLILFGVPLIIVIGLNGVIIGLIIAEMIRLFILIYGLYKSTGILYRPYKTVYQLISSIIMCVSVYYIHSIGLEPILLQVSVSIITGSLVYFTVMIIIDKKIQSYLKNYLS